MFERSGSIRDIAYTISGWKWQLKRTSSDFVRIRKFIILEWPINARSASVCMVATPRDNSSVLCVRLMSNMSVIRNQFLRNQTTSHFPLMVAVIHPPRLTHLQLGETSGRSRLPLKRLVLLFSLEVCWLPSLFLLISSCEMKSCSGQLFPNPSRFFRLRSMR